MPAQLAHTQISYFNASLALFLVRNVIQQETVAAASLLTIYTPHKDCVLKIA